MSEPEILTAASATKAGVAAASGALAKIIYDIWKRRNPLQNIKTDIKSLQIAVADLKENSEDTKVTMATLTAQQATKDDLAALVFVIAERADKNTAALNHTLEVGLTATNEGITRAHARIDSLLEKIQPRN